MRKIIKEDIAPVCDVPIDGVRGVVVKVKPSQTSLWGSTVTILGDILVPDFLIVVDELRKSSPDEITITAPLDEGGVLIDTTVDLSSLSESSLIRGRKHTDKLLHLSILTSLCSTLASRSKRPPKSLANTSAKTASGRGVKTSGRPRRHPPKVKPAPARGSKAAGASRKKSAKSKTVKSSRKSMKK